MHLKLFCFLHCSKVFTINIEYFASIYSYSLFQKFCDLDFKSLLFSEYLSHFAHFGVILFVGTSFVIFRTKMLRNSVKKVSANYRQKFSTSPTGAIPTLVLVHDYTRLCLCHLRCYFHHLTLDLSIDSGYLGLTLSFSENFTCRSFR